ncbi:hypothetical protein A7A08_03208 [Methyloligella halotolerans]|uniref:LysR substrate binding domain protein n=2 Tax=Methyloligella halotolerans TaxID=1177755 RepID=A0A1E2RUV6_9HYPH|nr:hypothetical protein A7A08_03208 [Methyloligella halotolerans]
MHERGYVDAIFKSIGKAPIVRVESESILHLILQAQFANLCTIIPSHFSYMPGLHRGTRSLELVEPEVSQDVTLFWAEGEIMSPMTSTLVEAVKKLHKQGGLDLHLDKAYRSETESETRERLAETDLVELEVAGRR